jgi:hypothetical protein
MHGAFYRCDRCDGKFCYVGFSDWYYNLDGRRLPVAVGPSWCLHCRTLRSAEALPTIEECERELERLSQLRTARGTRAASPKAIEYALLTLEWRRKRVSAPRCLRCGTTELRVLDTAPRDGLLPFEHPDCGGTIAYSKGFLGSATPTLYSAEGLLKS